MLRSFHYAPYAALLGQGGAETQDFTALEPWARFWHRWVSVAFVRAYLETAAGAAFLPRDGEQLRILLDAYLLDKAFYELSYELNNRPSWTPIPLQGIRQLLETGE
jgi:maltose alpha-D-glucosyltransferase/alpha-amylase